MSNMTIALRNTPKMKKNEMARGLLYLRYYLELTIRIRTITCLGTFDNALCIRVCTTRTDYCRLHEERDT